MAVYEYRKIRVAYVWFGTRLLTTRKFDESGGALWARFRSWGWIQMRYWGRA